MILTLAPIFFDRRFLHLRTKDHEDLLEHLAKLAIKSIGLPDAGLWEIRDGWRVHTFTNLMSWAGLERLERIQNLGYLRDGKINIREGRLKAESALQKSVVNGSVRNGPEDESFDSALALLAILRYPNTELSKKTLDIIIKELSVAEGSGFFYRYTRPDDFGNPQSAFVACSFWVVQALASLNRLEDAKTILSKAVQAANSLGLYSEHYQPKSKLQLGNFPQAYSHVGLINSAFAVSPTWAEVL